MVRMVPKWAEKTPMTGWVQEFEIDLVWTERLSKYNSAKAWECALRRSIWNFPSVMAFFLHPHCAVWRLQKKNRETMCCSSSRLSVCGTEVRWNMLHVALLPKNVALNAGMNSGDYQKLT
jgi:hypothetical protein